MPDLNPWRMRVRIHALLMLAGLAMLTACASSPPPQFDAAREHHRVDGFTNVHGPRGGKSLRDLLAWRWRAWRENRPAPPSTFVNGYDGFEVLEPPVANIVADTRASVTWIGHATAWIRLGSLNILTDPHFSERASPVSWAGPSRKVPLPVSLDALPRIDLVVLSHNHPDSLDETTVMQLANQPGGPPLFLVPLGVGAWFREREIGNVRELDWWNHYEFGSVRASFVPAQHWSARGLMDRNRSLRGGWVLDDGRQSIYFAGDSGYSRDFAEIGARFGGFDLALLPVGAYEPRWFMKAQHVNPDEAVQIHLDVRARRSIGIHWGTFELTDEPLDQPIGDLAAALNKYEIDAQDFRLLRHGETFWLTR